MLNKCKIHRFTMFALVLLTLLSLWACTSEGANESSDGFRQLSDLNSENIKLGVVSGDAVESICTEMFPKAELIYAKEKVDRMLMLKSGKIDGFVTYELGHSAILEQYPEFVAMPEYVKENPCAFFAAKNEHGQEVIEKVNAFVKEFKSSGKYAALYDKWNGDDESIKQMPDIDFTGENGDFNMVCWTTTYPYSYINDSGTVGIYPELMYLFCEEYGYKPVFHDVWVTAGITGIQTGKYDLFAFPIVVTEERKEIVIYSDIIQVDNLVMLVRRSDVAADVLAQIDADNGTGEALGGFRQASDLNKKGIRLGCVTGTMPESIFSNEYENAELSYFSTVADNAIALDSGKIDGFATKDSLMAPLLDEYRSIVMLPSPLKSYDCAFYAAKTERGEKIIGEFNSFIDEFEGGVGYERLRTKWDSGDESRMVMPESNYSGENGELKICCSSDSYPYCYVRNGEFTGLYVEVMNLFCEKAGYTPVYGDVNFTASIAGVLSGKYDISASETVITPERQEKMIFSTVLCSSSLYMFVRRADAAADVLAQIDAANGVVVSDSATDENVFIGFLNGLASSFEKNFIRENRWKMLLDGLLVTIEMAALSAVFGTVLGALVCFLRMRKNKFASGFATVYVKIFQGTPIVVLLLVLYYVIFGSTDITAFTVCVLGFSLDFSAYVSEMMRSGIEAVPVGQKKAALALGYGQTKAFIEIIMPQAIRHILPVYRGQLVSMVKMTSIAGYISVEDLTKVSDIIRSRTYEAFFPLICTAVIYFLLANLLTSLLKLIQLKIDPNNRKRLPKGVE